MLNKYHYMSGKMKGKEGLRVEEGRLASGSRTNGEGLEEGRHRPEN